MFSNLKKIDVYLSFPVKLVKKIFFSGGHQPVRRCQPPFSLKMLQSLQEKNMMFVCIISIMMTNFVVINKKMNGLETFKVSFIPGVLGS